MRVVALIENTKPEGRDDLTAEHGLSLYIEQELLRKHAHRFERVEEFTEILPKVCILTKIPRQYDLPRGNRKLFVKKDGAYESDDFGHELILVMEEQENLVVFTGCSHNGVLNMMAAVTRQFPDKPIKAVFGGFHLIGLPVLNTMAASKSEVRAMGKELLKFPVERIFTGHCTGKKAYRMLKEVMGQTLEYFPTGSDIPL